MLRLTVTFLLALGTPAFAKEVSYTLETVVRDLTNKNFQRALFHRTSLDESTLGKTGLAVRSPTLSTAAAFPVPSLPTSRSPLRGQLHAVPAVSTRRQHLVRAEGIARAHISSGGLLRASPRPARAVGPLRAEAAVGRTPYDKILQKQWFGEDDVYNVKDVEVLNAGKTTRLVKEATTGNVLLGYRGERDITISDPASITLEPDAGDEGGVAIATVPANSWETVGEAGPVPGDRIIQIRAGGQELECNKATTVEAATEFLKKSPSGPFVAKVSRERVVPAWLEPRVWESPAILQRTYNLEQEYIKTQKAVNKSYRVSPGLKASDVTIFEKGRQENAEGFNVFGGFFDRSQVKGEGSFGQVFDGSLKDGRTVVLKRPKTNTVGGSEMLQLEVVINEEVQKRVKPGIVAPFIGYIEVSEAEEGQIYAGYLSTGLWLVWEDLLGRTIDSYIDSSILGKGQISDELAKRMAVPGKDPTKAILTRVFEALGTLHEQGFVHRDIKPENLLVLEGGQLRLIDLASTASCLQRIVSYEVGAGPFDPAYSAEEDKFLLPAETERPEKANLPELWARLQPSKFDIYSAGVLLLQLACPSLRSRDALVKFQSAIMAAKYDLEAYRRSSGLKCALLDEDNGAGWDLTAKCLKLDRAERPTAQEALGHPFFGA